jgi:hypothetical protein
MKLSKEQIIKIETFVGSDVDQLKSGLISLLLICLQSQEELQLIFEAEFFFLFGELMDLLDNLRVDTEHPAYCE